MSDMQRKRKAERFVHHNGDHERFSLVQAFSCACCGITYALSTQRNFKIHGAFSLLAILLGFLLGIPSSSWCAVVLCIVLVFAMEMMNTAVESIVDLVSPEWNELAMRAKDCAAAAVYVCALGSVVVAAIVYLPPLIALISNVL